MASTVALQSCYLCVHMEVCVLLGEEMSCLPKSLWLYSIHYVHSSKSELIGWEGLWIISNWQSYSMWMTHCWNQCSWSPMSILAIIIPMPLSYSNRLFTALTVLTEVGKNILARPEVELNLSKEASRVIQIAAACMWQIIFCSSCPWCAVVSHHAEECVISYLKHHIVHVSPRPSYQQLVLKLVQSKILSLKQQDVNVKVGLKWHKMLEHNSLFIDALRLNQYAVW